ncbi:NAD(P)/FAD-dependent oxidoreductase [Neptunomonas japonica]|uniref:D-amino-acid dehydrogenase n=1 Tax=Neptunomonas japonica JAMM 1380 TaxID=1441457 RepID=A0A7R6P6T9_9GAMM|nr:FAD-binding oxidoreductase [Neptunomonas japonica]BBB28324.1 D-amino-acid dehydrogenase [Neptunomonas japonica JAMM 1380]
MQNIHIGILGAGIVGLSTALSLQEAGYKVTLIDKEAPGMGASFGNAGLFADYARLPFAKFAMMKKMPGMLLDKTSPLSMQGSYLPSLMPYGWEFFKACFPTKYIQGKEALTSLQEHTQLTNQELLNLTNAQDLIKSEGCLGLFATEEGFSTAQSGDLQERREQGVNLEFLNAHQVHELEPNLANFHAGGVFYPDTRFTISPVELSRRYAHHFSNNGGTILHDEVQAVLPNSNEVTVKLNDRNVKYDQVVICAGFSSKAILKKLGVKLPLVSERGYHLTLDIGEKSLSRPVGWLDKAVFLTPMEGGIRLAGTAEFAFADAPLNPQRADEMLKHAKVMLGSDPSIISTWVGSRPSTPDSLPVIGELEHHPRIKVGFGHGHLGLTFAAITGKLITQSIQGHAPAVDLKPFSAARFN